MQAIFDATVAASQVQQMLCVGSIRAQAGDRIGHICHTLVAFDPRSLDADRPGEA